MNPQQTMENGKRQVQKAVNQGSELAKDLTSQDFIGRAQGWYDSAEHMVTDVAKRSSDIAKRYPVPSLIGAAVCGYLFAVLFRRSTN